MERDIKKILDHETSGVSVWVFLRAFISTDQEEVLVEEQPVCACGHSKLDHTLSGHRCLAVGTMEACSCTTFHTGPALVGSTVREIRGTIEAREIRSRPKRLPISGALVVSEDLTTEDPNLFQRLEALERDVAKIKALFKDL